MCPETGSWRVGIREGFLRGGQQGKCASPQWKGWEGHARQREGHGDVVSLECCGIQAHLSFPGEQEGVGEMRMGPQGTRRKALGTPLRLGSRHRVFRSGGKGIAERFPVTTAAQTMAGTLWEECGWSVSML